MQTDNHYAVIIVGAGPAGISTALHIQRYAPELVAHTLILEKARHPRQKLCGGGVLPDGEFILRSLGLDITEVPHYDVDWAHFDYDGKGMRLRSEKDSNFAFRTIRRHEFDAWLAKKAEGRGMIIREGVVVKSVKSGKEGVRVETDIGELMAQVVVGADGSKGIVRRSIVRDEPAHAARLLEIVTDPKPDKSFHIQNDSYFDFFVVPQGILGYAWDFPALEQGQLVRVRGIYDSNIHNISAQVSLQEALAEELHRHGLDLGQFKLEGHPLRWFEAGSTFASARILLVGDAAGADALYGEGISFALGYGAIAARAIRDAFTCNDFSFKGYKASILNSKMGKALRWRTLFARFFYSLRSRRIQALLWHRLGPIIEWIVRMLIIGWAKREKENKNLAS